MKKRKAPADQLEPLKLYPSKKYGYDKHGQWLLLEDEAANWKSNDIIKNYSGGVSIRKIHGSVRPLRTGYYRVLKDDLGGDAPKDFIGVYEYGEAPLKTPNLWAKHIAKVGHKWYPLESVSEHLLNRIGEVLGLNMAHSQLRVAHGQLRFLSRYFLKEGENMIHGAQIYSTYLQENDHHFVQEIEDENWARKLLTFQFTNEAIKSMFPSQHEEIMNQLVKLLVYDAITGNNDRHFYNWAIITHITGKNPPKFSPIYDSARGLFWNKDERTIKRKFYETKDDKTDINYSYLDFYMKKSRPKIGWEGWSDETDINHFQLIANINKHYPQYQNICKELIKKVYLQSIHTLIDQEFITFYTSQRLYLIKECLKKRFEILNHLCKTNCYD